MLSKNLDEDGMIVDDGKGKICCLDRLFSPDHIH